jgi:hypothetical protein
MTDASTVIPSTHVDTSNALLTVITGTQLATQSSMLCDKQSLFSPLQRRLYTSFYSEATARR